jgi:hypothetical protein
MKAIRAFLFLGPQQKTKTFETRRNGGSGGIVVSILAITAILP